MESHSRLDRIRQIANHPLKTEKMTWGRRSCRLPSGLLPGPNPITRNPITRDPATPLPSRDCKGVLNKPGRYQLISPIDERGMGAVWMVQTTSSCITVPIRLGTGSVTDGALLPNRYDQHIAAPPDRRSKAPLRCDTGGPSRGITDGYE
jgi:hypothetical protein